MSESPDASARIEVQSHVYAALQAEITARVTMQHQLVVVAAAFAGADASFLSGLLAHHRVAADFALSGTAVLFLALATAYAEHDVFTALRRSALHNLSDFNIAAYGQTYDKTLREEGEALGRTGDLRHQWLDFLMTLSEYVITLGVGVAAAAFRLSRGHLFAHTGEIFIYLFFVLLAFGFVATAIKAASGHRSSGRAYGEPLGRDQSPACKLARRGRASEEKMAPQTPL